MKRSLLALLTLGGLTSYGQMTTTGNAAQFGGTCNCYELTNSTNQAGAIWSPNTIDLTNGFDMTFKVYLGTANGGADGMTFVLQQNPNGLGFLGHGMGYKTPAPNPNPISAQSLAIELDTWNSGVSAPGDIGDDHIGINRDGSVSHNVQAAQPFPGSMNIEDGAYHDFRVTYNDAIKTLQVFWDGSATALVTYFNPVFIADHFSGNPNVYFGFTAGTGGAFNAHRVCSYGAAAFTTDLSSVCPGTPIQFTDGSSSDTQILSSWSWDFGDLSPLNTSQSPSYTYTSPGNYTAELTMTDGFGCAYQATAPITVLPDLILSMDSTDVTCFGDMDGIGMATSTNGSGPYTYSWNDGGSQTTQTATGLTGGVYTVTVTDALGCMGTDSITVIEPLEFTIDVTGNDIVCFGDSTGDATANLTNGIAPFTYSWNDYLSQTTATATNLFAGTYTATVTDDKGCVAVDSVTLNEGPEIIVTGVTTPDDGTTNGTIDITASGGVPPLSFSWGAVGSTEDLTDLAAGTYQVTVTDDNGCEKKVIFEVGSSVGLSSFTDSGFNLYPNPATDHFIIEGSGDFKLQILDMSGKLIYAGIHSDFVNIDRNSMETGIYMILLEVDGQEFVEKLVLK